MGRYDCVPVKTPQPRCEASCGLWTQVCRWPVFTVPNPFPPHLPLCQLALDSHSHHLTQRAWPEAHQWPHLSCRPAELTAHRRFPGKPFLPGLYRGHTPWIVFYFSGLPLPCLSAGTSSSSQPLSVRLLSAGLPPSLAVYNGSGFQ